MSVCRAPRKKWIPFFHSLNLSEKKHGGWLGLNLHKTRVLLQENMGVWNLNNPVFNRCFQKGTANMNGSKMIKYLTQIWYGFNLGGKGSIYGTTIEARPNIYCAQGQKKIMHCYGMWLEPQISQNHNANIWIHLGVSLREFSTYQYSLRNLSTTLMTWASCFMLQNAHACTYVFIWSQQQPKLLRH